MKGVNVHNLCVILRFWVFQWFQLPLCISRGLTRLICYLSVRQLVGLPLLELFKWFEFSWFLHKSKNIKPDIHRQCRPCIHIIPHLQLLTERSDLRFFGQQKRLPSLKCWSKINILWNYSSIDQIKHSLFKIFF